jgi:Co/Zn/Cd efflux system component
MGFGHDHSHGHSHGHHESYEYNPMHDDEDEDDIELTLKISNNFDKNNIPVKNHKFLDIAHQENEIRTWGVIVLCLISMIIEIICGVLYGSLALIGDGVHMSTHAIAFFITATSYSYARKHENDSRYVFGTAKVGELAAFTSAIILIAISLFILYEGIVRFIQPADLQYAQALPVSFVGLFVNIVSGVILTMDCKKYSHNGNQLSHSNEAKCGHGHGEHSTHEDHHDHDHGHQQHDTNHCDHNNDENEIKKRKNNTHPKYENDHGHDHGHDTNHCDHTPKYENDHGHDHGHDTNHCDHIPKYENDHDHDPGHDHGHNTYDETFNLDTSSGILKVSIYEDGIPPVFRLSFGDWKGDIPDPKNFVIKTIRPDKSKEVFRFSRLNDSYYQSINDIPEPHQFSAIIRINNEKKETFRVEFVESEGHDHSHGHSIVINIGDNSINNRKDKSNLIMNGKNVGNIKIKKEKYEQDNNYRAAIIHVVADAIVSVLVIIALVLAGNIKQCYFLDPLVGIIGSLVILSWGLQLINDTSSNLLDIVPDKKLNKALYTVLEKDGSIITDFHVWRVGPGKLSSVISIIAPKCLPSKAQGKNRYEYYSIQYYNNRIKGFKAISHTTFEIIH